MGQHYIPRYYLEGFTEFPDSSNIWVYEKGDDRVFQTSIKSVANENNRWPRSVEEYLANRIETPAKPVLDKIRNRRPITQSDKDTLSAYMVLMLQRVPRGFERMKAKAPEVLDKLFNDLEMDIKRLVEEHPSKKDTLQNRLHELSDWKLKYEKDFPMEVWYQNLRPDALPKVRAVLPAMTWIFLTSDKRQSFLTNDNPLFFFEGMGIGRPESEITFPISSRVTLWATWRKNLREGYIAAKDSIIREINRRTASATTKYAYYSEQAKWVVRLINNKNLRLNRLV
jgi:hypothetical protein